MSRSQQHGPNGLPLCSTSGTDRLTFTPTMMTSSLGYAFPRKGLPPHLSNEDMQSELLQKMKFLAPVSTSGIGYRVIFPDYRNVGRMLNYC